MKERFLKTYKGHQFEFLRVLSSSLDPWYYISVVYNRVEVKCRMHKSKEGNWKITILRLPPWLYALENDFDEVIKMNETYVVR